MSQKEQERKVFVRGLPAVVSKQRLKAFFSRFGPVQDLQLRLHPQYLVCLGQVTVTFLGKKTAQELIGSKVYYEGYSLECNRFYSGQDLKLNIKLENKLKLLIFGLPLDMTSEELARGMNFFKAIKKAYVVLDRRFEARNKGYGVLIFKSEAYKEVFFKISKDMRLIVNGQQLSVSDNLSDSRKNLEHPHQINSDDEFSKPHPITPKTGASESPKIESGRKLGNPKQSSGPVTGREKLETSVRAEISYQEKRKMSDKPKTTKEKIIERSRKLFSSPTNYRLNRLAPSH